MKKPTRMKRAGAVLVAAALLLSSMSSSLTVFASDSWPNSKAAAEPSFAGYRVKDIKNWSPETDPYAEFLRAEVPLQERNEAFKATQAKPYLNSDAQVMLMQGDYGNSFFNSTMYTDKFGEHVLNFWQYSDYFSPWHGAATAYTPEAIYDPITSDWQARGFEFGIVNIPNPAYTNAAHKNGVMSIACIYFDPAFRPGQTCADLVEKDENGEYSIADKLIEMAEYMGFDGYFLNQEEGRKEDFKPFMAKLTAAGLYTQWYDTNSNFNASKAEWLKDDVNGQINNSVFVNYGWNYGIDSSLDYAKQIGVDPFESIFIGAECNQNKFSGGHSSARNITALYDETGNPRASVALFTPSDWYQRGVDEVPFYDGKSTPPMQRDEFQWMVSERERMFFSGVKCDPTDTGLKPGYSRPDVQVTNASGWVGVADFIAERSVIDGTKFYTNFNTGHGMQYFVDGKVSADKAWTNINIQDILPTWQWWMESSADKKLSVDFDYGSALTNHDTSNNPITLPYTQVGAYNGGSSLVVYGDVTGTNSLHLYKTDLAVNENSKAYVTFKKTSNDAVAMQLGLIFKDAPETTEKLDITGSETAGDWTTVEVDLSKYAGKSIAAITLEFAGEAEGYQMNVGGLKVSDGADKPATPTGFTVDYGYATGEMILSWDMANYDTVKQYNVYGTLSDGRRVYLGGIYDSILYVKSVFGEQDSIDLELRAVGADGTESDPATVTFNFKDKVSNLKVKEAKTSTGLLVRAATPGKLKVSFDAPAAGAPDSYEFEVTLRNIAKDDPDNQVYTYTTAGDVTSAEVPLPVDESYEYDLKVYSVRNGEKGDAICYRGWSNDSYSKRISKHDIRISGTSVRLVDPDSVDWYKMHVEFNGSPVTSFKRGGVARFTATMRCSLPGTTGILSVVTEDFAGNKSIPTTIELKDGQIVPLDMSELQKLVDDAAQYQEKDYTEETWPVFVKAYEQAKAMLASDDVVEQEVTAMIETLKAAIAQLEKFVPANKTLLQKTYDYAKDLSTEGVTDSAKAYFEKVLAEAKTVLDNYRATQEEVDTAWDNLLEGIWSLGLTQGDKTELNKLIAIAEEMIVNKDKYVPDHWELLTKALEDAKRVAADGDAMDEDIQPVSDALLNAIHMQRYKANKANLEDLINKANGLDLSKYTDESVAVLRSALKAANLVMDNESLTNSKQDQAVVNEAAADLKAAIDQLKVKDDASNPDNPSDPDDGSKPDDGNKPNDGNKGETPTTGDNAPVMAVAGLMLVAGAAMMVVLMRRKADKA